MSTGILTPAEEKDVELRVATAFATGKLEGEMGVTWDAAMAHKPEALAKSLAVGLLSALARMKEVPAEIAPLLPLLELAVGAL